MSSTALLVPLVLVGIAGAQSTTSLRGSNVSSVAGRAIKAIAESHGANLAPNTAGSNVSLRTSSMDGWPFQMGPSNSILCPDGYAQITSEDDCSKAANYYNWPYSGKVERNDLPGNCFMGPYPHVYLNSVVGTGSSLEKGWEPMCIRRPETKIVPSLAGSATNDFAESHDANLVANATDSNMALRASSMDGWPFPSMDVWPFKMGPSNSISCPDGYAKITSEDECSKAAEYYNWPYSGKVEREDLPGNCFMGPYPHVYLNSVIGTGSSLEKGWEPMCIKRP